MLNARKDQKIGRKKVDEDGFNEAEFIRLDRSIDKWVKEKRFRELDKSREEIAEELNMELVIKKLEWDALLPAIDNDVIDAIIAGMSDAEERRVNVDFTAAYYRSTHVLVMDKNSQYVNGKTLWNNRGPCYI